MASSILWSFFSKMEVKFKSGISKRTGDAYTGGGALIVGEYGM